MPGRSTATCLLLVACCATAGCADRSRFATGGEVKPVSSADTEPAEPAPAQPPARHTDEIVIAGQRFHTGAPVVLWSDPGGYSASSSGPGGNPPFDVRFARGGLEAQELAGINRDGWKLPDLQRHVDQLVLHFDVCGVSAVCQDVLSSRGLSVHFLLDIDGTIYQTMDVQQRAWHATKANDRSVGIEIANIGAYSQAQADPLAQWYARDSGGTFISIPLRVQQRYGARGGVRASGQWPLRPARDQPVVGSIHGQALRQYDFTPQQYDSLTRLTAALHRALPAIRLDCPRGPDGRVLGRTLTDAEFTSFRGVLGHWHVQQNKNDPGPALDWQRLITGARQLVAR